MLELRLITARKPNLYLGNPSSGLIFYSFYSPGGNRSSGHSVGLKNYPLTSESTAILQLYLCFTPCCSVFVSREEPLTHKRKAGGCSVHWSLVSCFGKWNPYGLVKVAHRLLAASPPTPGPHPPSSLPFPNTIVECKIKKRDHFLHLHVEYRVKHN